MAPTVMDRSLDAVDDGPGHSGLLVPPSGHLFGVGHPFWVVVWHFFVCFLLTGSNSFCVAVRFERGKPEVFLRVLCLHLRSSVFLTISCFDRA